MNVHKKTAESFKTTTATTPNAIKSIAACALGSYAKAIIRAKPHAGMGEAGQGAVKGCDSIRSGAQNTKKQAGNLPDSEVFSRPEFKVLGVGIVYPQGRRHNLFCVLNPHTHPECLKSAKDGFSVQQGTKTMTNVNTPTTPANGTTSTLARQQAIENALSMALFHIRHGDTQQGIRAATAKAIRAASLLKQACTEIQISGRA